MKEVFDKESKDALIKYRVDRGGRRINKKKNNADGE